MLLLGSAWMNQGLHHLSRNHSSADNRKRYLRTDCPYFYLHSSYVIVVCWHAEGLRLVYTFLMQQSAESNWCSWTSFSLLWRAAAVGCSADGVLSATYVCPSLFLIVSTGASVLIICCQLFLRKAMRLASHIHACSLCAAVALE